MLHRPTTKGTTLQYHGSVHHILKLTLKKKKQTYFTHMASDFEQLSIL